MSALEALNAQIRARYHRKLTRKWASWPATCSSGECAQQGRYGTVCHSCMLSGCHLSSRHVCRLRLDADFDDKPIESAKLDLATVKLFFGDREILAGDVAVRIEE